MALEKRAAAAVGLLQIRPSRASAGVEPDDRIHGQALVRRSTRWRLPRREAVGIFGISGNPRVAWAIPRNRLSGAPVCVCQAMLAIQWLWSLRMLWVAATNRHSDCAAALPLRMNR